MKKVLAGREQLYHVSFVLLALFAVITLGVFFWPASARYDSSLISLFSPIRGQILTPAMIFFTNLGEWYSITILVLVSLAVLLKMKKTRLAGALLISVVGGEAIVWIIKNVAQMARPEVLSHLVNESGYSFPSGHAFVALSFYGLLAYVTAKKAKKKWAKLAIEVSGVLLILLMGASRIALGVHWPSDIIGSYTLGAAWVSAIIIYLESKKEFK